MKMTLGEHEVVPLDQVRPYWRNPRRVTEEAVNMLAESLKNYGYQQPIVVDEKYVIIVGHTRYAALRRLKATEVPVVVATGLTQAQVKEYRLVDNRAAEMTSWDYTSLVDELEELDSMIANQFFPEMGDEDVEGFDPDVELLAREWDKVDTNVEFTCPSCFHQWNTEVTKEQIMSGTIGERKPA